MNLKLLTHFLQSRVVELFPIISDDQMWDSKSADDVPPYEICVFGFGDYGERLCFYPLSEVIDLYDSKLSLCSSSWKRFDQIYPRFYEWLGIDNGREGFRRLSWDVG